MKSGFVTFTTGNPYIADVSPRSPSHSVSSKRFSLPSASFHIIFFSEAHNDNNHIPPGGKLAPNRAILLSLLFLIRYPLAASHVASKCPEFSFPTRDVPTVSRICSMLVVDAVSCGSEL